MNIKNMKKNYINSKLITSMVLCEEHNAHYRFLPRIPPKKINLLGKYITIIPGTPEGWIWDHFKLKTRSRRLCYQLSTQFFDEREDFRVDLENKIIYACAKIHIHFVNGLVLEKFFNSTEEGVNFIDEILDKNKDINIRVSSKQDLRKEWHE